MLFALLEERRTRIIGYPVQSVTVSDKLSDPCHPNEVRYVG